jgi:hypothetical protein
LHQPQVVLLKLEMILGETIAHFFFDIADFLPKSRRPPSREHLVPDSFQEFTGSWGELDAMQKLEKLGIRLVMLGWILRQFETVAELVALLRG